MNTLVEILRLDDAVLGLGGGFAKHFQTSTAGDLGLRRVINPLYSQQVAK